MPANDLQILEWLLTTHPETQTETLGSVVRWKQQHAKTLFVWPASADMALAGGFLAPCPAFAFAAGYWAALQRLLPDLPREKVPALCISEKHGAHPAKINCRLVQDVAGRWHLDGKKHFVTCGKEAQLLLVAASTGTDPDGKNQLRLALVDADQSGISVAPLEKPIHILPEISHSRITFDHIGLQPEDLLPGDGYLKYIKPFRTIEDLHVTAALVGYLLRTATLFAWPGTVKERCLSQAIAVRTLAMADYTAPAIHIATGGVFASMKELLAITDPCWEQVPFETRSAWQRDRSVLDIAATARDRRLAVAWERFA